MLVQAPAAQAIDAGTSFQPLVRSWCLILMRGVCKHCTVCSFSTYAGARIHAGPYRFSRHRSPDRAAAGAGTGTGTCAVTAHSNIGNAR